MHLRGSVTIDLTTHLNALSCVILFSLIVTYLYFYLYIALYIVHHLVLICTIKKRQILNLSIPYTTFQTQPQILRSDNGGNM